MFKVKDKTKGVFIKPICEDCARRFWHKYLFQMLIVPVYCTDCEKEVKTVATWYRRRNLTKKPKKAKVRFY